MCIWQKGDEFQSFLKRQWKMNFSKIEKNRKKEIKSWKKYHHFTFITFQKNNKTAKGGPEKQNEKERKRRRIIELQKNCLLY
jgi:hypothetical protein